MCTYFRAAVDVPAWISEVPELEVYIHVDDGAAVYVNGVEAFRRGIEAKEIVFSSPGKFKPKEETFKVPSSIFKPGKNVIAVEVHQDGPDSSDLWFELGITAPGRAKPAAALAAPVAPLSPQKGEVAKVTMTLMADPATGRAFTWYTTPLSRRNDLQIVEKAAGSADFSKAKRFNGTQAFSTNSPEEICHKAEASGLKPGASYWYRVGDERLDLWSAAGSFTTAKTSGGFSFIDLADTQAKTEEEASLSARTLATASSTLRDAAFMILNGDIVDTGMNELQWNWMLGDAAPTLMNLALVPVAGNHDEDPESFIEHFALPVPEGAATKTGAYYSFDCQNAHFIVLNNNEDSAEWANFTPEQISWLKADVARAKKAGALWIIVAMHKGPYTTSNHATDADIMGANGVRTKWAPLASDLGIDLVLQGHDHLYARTKPLAGDKPAAKGGTTYVIPGTAGPKVYYRNKKIDSSYFNLFAVAEECRAAVYGPDPSDASRPVRSTIQNFMGVSIAGGTLTATVWEIDQRKDPNAPYVVDKFTIRK
jgi:hypothetical protein